MDFREREVLQDVEDKLALQACTDMQGVIFDAVS